MAVSSGKQYAHRPRDETTPLLFAEEAGRPILGSDEPSLYSADGRSKVQDDIDEHEEEDKSLPMLQMFLLCYARLVEPLAFFCIFPFIPQMIQRTGVVEADIGFYSGLIESLFSVTQTILMLGWGHAADRFGRKPVLVFSLTGMAICTALFGFSQSLVQMIVLRSMAGVFGGTLVTIRTMVSENATSKTQARAFSFFAFSGNMGIFLGPAIGGLFAEPAKSLPSTFGRIPLFQQFPYALPTLATGTLAASAALTSAIWLNETFDRKAISGGVHKGPMSTGALLKQKGIPLVLYIYSHVMMLGMAYTAVMPVFYYSSVKLGGYALSPQWSSIFMAGGGLAQAAWLLIAFPPLQRRFGTAGVLRGCIYAWPLLFISCPLYNVFLRLGWEKAFWIAAPPTVALSTGVAMAFTTVQLALNEVSPSPATLGTLNALALTMSSATRAFTPGLFASIFATGVRTQLLGGYLVWAILIANAVMVAFAMQWLPATVSNGRQTGRVKK